MGNSIDDLGLTDLLNDKIYDVTLEGAEHQVIAPDEFFGTLEKIGIKPDNEEDYATIERVLKLTSSDFRWYFVENLIELLQTFGVREHKPDDTNFIKYYILKGRDIRIINRFIHICKRENVTDIRRIFGNALFSQKVISTKNKGKKRTIDLIYTENFFERLKALKVTKTIELEANLRNLLCLSPDKQELIMIDKLVKVYENFTQSR